MLKKACIFLALLNFCFTVEAQKKTSNNPESVSNPSNNPSNPSTPTETFVGTYNNEIIDQIYAITNKVEETQNFVNLGTLSPDSNVALPFGIIKEVGAVRYSICVDSMKFKPNGAFFSACAAIEFPAAKKKIAFRAGNVRFNPTGVIGGEQARLYLATSHTIQINPSVILRLLNDNSNWVEWDCNGFKAIHLKGYFEFSRGKLLPDTTVVPGAKVVKASFEVYTQNIHEFVTTMNITPFCVNGLNGWGFKVTDATVDMSELRNSPGFSFPPDYPTQNLASLEAWTGFSLKSLVIRLPKEISKTGKKTEVAASNMLIDNMGVSGLFQVNNLFPINEGSASGWAFSVEEIGVGFVTNRINSGRFKGKIQVPITKENEQFVYTANIHHSYNTSQTNYNFVVSPANSVSFAVFGAKVNLNNNSNIAISVVNGNFRPSANLSGQISFETPKLNSNGGYLGFENMIIIPEAPYIPNAIFTLHNIGGGQTKAHNYPITINELLFGIDQGAPILGFSVTLNLSQQNGNGISIGTGVKLRGKINVAQQTYNGEYPVTHTKTNWQFEKVVMTGFSIDLKTSPFTLKGSVLFKDDDPVYGNAFIGSLALGIPSVLSNTIGVNVCFGSKPEYKYFYLDAHVPTNIQIGPYITITKIMGGLYHHMSPNKVTETDLIALVKNPIGSTNALSYTPDINTSIGLKSGVSYKLLNSEYTANGDLMLDINFTNSGGLGTVKLSGEIFSMATVPNRPKAPIKGAMVVIYDAPEKIFDAMGAININAYNAITGTGTFKIHLDPQVWYFCVGRPTSPNNISFFSLANVPSYFMVGNTLDPPSPLPSAIANNPAFTSIVGKRDANQLKNASGFCSGSRITSSMEKILGPPVLNAKASYNFEMGWDMMMANYGENAHCAGSADKVGMNGWLAEGQMFLAMQGNVSINGSYKWPSDCPRDFETHPICGKGHCCCIKGTIKCIINGSFSRNLLSGSLNAVVIAKGPKPIYFAGKVNCQYDICEALKGNFDFDYEYGQKCTPVSN